MKRNAILTFFASVLFLIVPLGPSIGNSHPHRAEKKKCPTVEVNGPNKSKAFRNILYRAKVKNFPGATAPIFKWSIVGGILLQGQGEDVITVDPRALQIKPTLVIENFPVGCDSNSDTVVTKLTDIPYLDPPPLITSFNASPASLVRGCPPKTASDTCTPTGTEVQLSVDVVYPLDLDLLFTWYVTVGQLKGEGKTVTWDLSGVASGTYKVSVEATFFNPDKPRLGPHAGTGSTTVTISDCNGCKPMTTKDEVKPSSHPSPPRVTWRGQLRSTDTLR